MIIGFKDKEAEKIFRQKFSKRYSLPIQKIILRKLIILDLADSIADLRSPPGNHLESLQGDRLEQYSVRINNQYRLCFQVNEDNCFYNVEIIDYH